MKLSIIVPAYNAEKLIERTIQSLVNQSIRGGYEIIIVNDGSKDSTLELIQEWHNKLPDFIKIINKENGGVSSARNAGLGIAQGEWIFFCDADDYITDYSIGKLIEIAEIEHPNVGLINFSLVHETRLDSEVELSYNLLKLYKGGKDCFRNGLFWCTWLFLFKREIIQTNKLFFKNVVASEDSLFNIEYLLSMPADVPVLKYDTKVYHYYNNPESVSRDFDSSKSVAFLTRLFPVFGYYKDVIDRFELVNADYERMKWVMAKNVSNYFVRMLHSNIGYYDVKREREKLVRVGAIPFKKVTKSQLNKHDKIVGFLISHPILFCMFRVVYARIKHFKYK